MSSLIAGVQAAWEAIETAAGYTETATGYQGVIGKAARLACDAYARNPELTWATSIGLGLTLDRGCEAYLAQTNSNPTGTPPFTGGQCQGIPYIITGTTTTQFGTYNLGPQQAFGPVNVFSRMVGDTFQVVYTDANTPEPNVIFGQNTAGVPGTISPVVTRQDGQPDNCGNITGRYPTNPPPGPGEYGNTYNVDIAGGGNVDVTIGFPSVNIDGEGNITIDIGGEPVNTGPGEPDSCGPDGFTPDGSGPTSPTGTEGEEEAQQQTVIVGLRTTITTDIVDGSTYPIASGVLRIPRIGWVQFREPQSQQWSDAISIRVKPSQFTPCPWQWGADRVRWRFYNGVQGNAQAITKKIDQE